MTDTYELPEPKYIYHTSNVAGEDDLFVFADSGAVDIRDDGSRCDSCERLYTADQMRAYGQECARVERERWIRGVKISIPTDTMEQEFATHERRGRMAERERCARIVDLQFAANNIPLLGEIAAAIRKG